MPAALKTHMASPLWLGSRLRIRALHTLSKRLCVNVYEFPRLALDRKSFSIQLGAAAKSDLE
jgi:hypothetical protein